MSIQPEHTRGEVGALKLAPQDMRTISEGVDVPNKSILLEYIHWQIFTQNSNFIVFVEGLPGTGKSWTSLGILERWSEKVGKTFTVKDNVCSTPASLMRHIALLETRFSAGESVRGTALIFDDAGVSMDSRKWFEEVHKILNDTCEVMRYLGIILFITAPRKKRIDTKIRDLGHATLKIKKKVQGSHTVCKFYLNEQHWKTGQEIFKLLRALHHGWTYRLDCIRVKPPSVKLRNEYENWMQQFKGKIIQQSYAKLSETDAESVPKEKRRKLTSRQKEIYTFLRSGLNVEAVSRHLLLSEFSVKRHMAMLRAKGWGDWNAEIPQTI